MAAQNPPRRPTIDDVAAESGVSRGTVSRAINGGKWVSPEAQRAVDAAIKKTGYRPNVLARGLKMRRSGSVAFLLSEPVQRLFTDPNFATLMSETSDQLAAQDTSMVILLAATDQERDRTLDFISTGQIDGVILVSWHGDSSMLKRIQRAGIPAIFCGVPGPSHRDLSYVACDEYDGGLQMTEYLRGRGHRSIALITGPDDAYGSQRREAAFVDAMGSDYDPSLRRGGDWSRRSGTVAMNSLLDEAGTIDAVFAANDLMAAGAIEAIRSRGLSVPGDIAVGGFDDSEAAVQSTPELTTMHQPFAQIAQEMVRLLLARIDGGPSVQMTLRTTLVVRDSA
ncbi:LacI family transcriptional regulator [Rathayibacter sp. PhB127]|uniref:LacI family DNA-binding transcriptional regulator n=1 Tax=Rathayibacter sp. PhB127 TaxID=2485176 RepID=UPI000F4BAA65|nr:LacI family DNA-binding transcriptional regulator [Rathayibacter sp. PhB127]ROS21579.1 LacI family transcriptional regulator [Rathayibacter sp. PhB127]